jgi:nitroreductase
MSIPLDFTEYPLEEMIRRAVDLHEEMRRRRSIRHFSSRPVPGEVIEQCLRTAGTAPSGANMQPWSFVVVSDPAVKRRIRERAEEQERALYEHRASEKWLEALAPLGTDAHKPFLEHAPYLIVILAQRYGLAPDGSKVKHYYVTESVGIATGMLLTAIHHAGLAALTYTPSPMRFLCEILDRPSNERPFLVLAVGYPAEGASVPDIRRKALDEIATFV